ncbi:MULTISPECIES: hemerythrin domain-containing protein [Streptomycetaceae]|uniref:hemerythrin domain-containing protein n=1 Tax=Streptomycetaceae TaxID=2062 RepID=UPI00087D2B04|nr:MULTISPECIES: hemerythrin domain-containing protein [Streptomycetaceae]MCX4752386.1 hemerythrin domain-containing protein [Kitasatospora purpeofusca]WSR31962.1 hemerythrin domain-containing protein [Kitasatospora purpeofusca]WSR39989.1 hemerythrin domain-containing protein [Kitasatospora purpeofusca]WTA54254.1 hemerythrin domain-containing protein [Kitasatospora purpeofusca]SDT77665.1 Hemerythrin HHE cation binding domain-containing protein [Streptomyces sp. TLI_053]
MPSHLLPVASPVSPAVPTQGGPVHDRTADEEPQAFRFAGLRLVHSALRRDLARLPNALRLLQPGEDEKGAALLRHWTFVTAVLSCHHEQQDTRIWPIVRRFAPELRLLLNWLESDHHNLDHSFTRVTTLVRIASRDTGSVWPVAYAIEDLAARLETHLRVEERQLLPRMELVFTENSRVGSLPELLDVMHSADGPGTPDALAWLLDGVEPALVERLLADCDDLVARHWPHWQATYQRCTAPLWGPPEAWDAAGE